MLPRDLKSEHFAGYSLTARKLALQYLVTLQRVPLSFLPSLLREIKDYDFKFPIERRALERELANLASLSTSQLNDGFRGFAQIKVSSELEHSNWAASPDKFVEQLSSDLWTTHQLDAFRAAAISYSDRLSQSLPPENLPIPRLGITIVGRDVKQHDGVIFRKLRAHGAYFSALKPENSLESLLQAVAKRAKAYPAPYAHWYIDGADELEHDSSITCISYNSLKPAREALLRKMQAEIERPGMGPEELRALLAQIRPAEVGLNDTKDPVLDHFKLKLLSEGSGTQIFSTTFVQWAAREALRRAQPLTLLVRFAPRQRQRSMNELLSATSEDAELDVLGSLIDADMGAYYNWINQRRLAGAEQSAFLAWFEDHGVAMAIGPSVPRTTESTNATDMKGLLSWIV